MTSINQKEYLKRYLGIGKAPGEKKKKKKKEKPTGNRLKIIDDDVDVLISKEIEVDLSAANEDAPQIVAIIDERPPSLQVDEKTKSNLWTPIGDPNNAVSDIQSVKLNSFKLGKQRKSTESRTSTVSIKKESVSERYSHYENSDNETVSATKNVKHERYANVSSKSISEENSNSPKRKYRRYSVSPPRRKIKIEDQPSSKNLEIDEGDQSPTRIRNRSNSASPRRRNENDFSPPRRKDKTGSSPVRRDIHEEDSSPTRRRNKEEDFSPPRRRNDKDDFSPRRKNKRDNSPARKEIKKADNSPPRKRNKDSSPPRKQKTKDSSPARRRDKERNSPQREKNHRGESKRKGERLKRTRWNSEEPSEPPMINKNKTTLDGKQAGLQNAQDLLKESKYLRQKEDDMFQNMSAEVSGRNAATITRGKKIKDPEEEAAKEKRQKEMKEKYDRWGKGLKQVEDQNKKAEEQLHEMSKPLARYADDEDLEKFLKEQERDGDPMLAYIRKKKRKERVAAGVPEKPMYMGEFMPNRFGIRPGYRWDGVDRSNGYEKKWFQVQNSKKANLEEAFKWSTEDM